MLHVKNISSKPATPPECWWEVFQKVLVKEDVLSPYLSILDQIQHREEVMSKVSKTEEIEQNPKPLKDRRTSGKSDVSSLNKI